MNKRGILPIVTLLVIAGLLIVVGVGYWAVEKAKAPEQPQQLLGGDRDVHGCIGSAGYSWCEAKQKCLRVWEEKCETASSSTPAVR